VKDALGRVGSVAAFGAGSDIARATVLRLVRRGTRIAALAAREPERLEPFAAQLRSLGAADVRTLAFDADAFDTHPGVVRWAFDLPTDLDVALVAFGVLGDQAAAERDAAVALPVLRTNLLGAVSILIPVAERMREQGHGTIVVLSSVAAERGRKSNFVYGASKAGLDTFSQGLGDRLAGTGVRIMVVRPGFVRSKMTAALPPAPLAVTPRDVADAIVDGLRTGAETVWVPSTLRWVMSGLRHTPRPIFRRLEV
jgi:decaprenylphospho-beta-D-erythro-pentofuranosid-2-ulose 2-reductase